MEQFIMFMSIKIVIYSCYILHRNNIDTCLIKGQTLARFCTFQYSYSSKSLNLSDWVGQFADKGSAKNILFKLKSASKITARKSRVWSLIQTLNILILHILLYGSLYLMQNIFCPSRFHGCEFCDWYYPRPGHQLQFS